MSKLGTKLVKALEQFRDDVRAGKPMEQTIRRRMIVKGKTVFTRETLVAPLTPPTNAARDAEGATRAGA